MENAASNKTPPFSAIIVAAGSGVRAGTDRPKQYCVIAGKPVLRHTLEQFLACPGLQRLQVVINPEHRALYDDAVAGLDLPEPAYGGDTRKYSVYNGLLAFSNLKNEDIILVHDAARPFVTPAEIIRVAAALTTHRAATLATPVADTLRHARDEDNSRMAGHFVGREGLWAIQTPQGFHYSVLKDAHEKAAPDISVTDDTGLASAAGYDVAIIPGTRQNFKITTADDLDLATKLLKGMQ